MSAPTRFTGTGKAVAPGPTTDDANPAILGRGWSFPPTFVRQRESVAMVAGDPGIRESLWIILSTNLGERTMLATFGCDLWPRVFTTLSTTHANEIARMVSNAIIEWEPRVTVERVAVTERPQSHRVGWVDIVVDYVVRQTNSRSNLVYPYYRLEATIPDSIG